VWGTQSRLRSQQFCRSIRKPDGSEITRPNHDTQLLLHKPAVSSLKRLLRQDLSFYRETVIRHLFIVRCGTRVNWSLLVIVFGSWVGVTVEQQSNDINDITLAGFVEECLLPLVAGHDVCLVVETELDGREDSLSADTVDW
jgi:hypothetical protein